MRTFSNRCFFSFLYSFSVGLDTVGRAHLASRTVLSLWCRRPSSACCIFVVTGFVMTVFIICFIANMIIVVSMGVFSFVVIIDAGIMLPFAVMDTVDGFAVFVIVIVDNVVVSILKQWLKLWSLFEYLA